VSGAASRVRPRHVLLALGAAAVGAGLYSTSGLASFGARPSGERLARIERSPNYRDGKFQNLVGTRDITTGTLDVLRKQFLGPEQRVPPGPVPLVGLTRRAFDAPPASGLRAVWLGHATVLLEIDGCRVLFDPVWSTRISPSSLAGPERFFPPPLPLEELPPLDAVVISHDHYDHLDMTTARALARTGVRFFVPLGIGAHLERWSVPAPQIVELDWGESAPAGALTLTARPARHYSSRGLFDRDAALWASWVVVGPSHHAFFSGDTGYSDTFKETGERYGPFDLTLIKIGAYAPEWPDVQITPEEALDAHEALRGAVMLPIHWGTFNLAFHAWNEPPKRLLEGARRRGVAVVIPRPGQLVEPKALPPLEPWWELLPG
jgi:L-ascorbate metabolism protein UlaG (beta-lactamase superfamily)